MPAETAQEKGWRLLREQRLVIERVQQDGLVVASCEGDHDTYVLGFDPTRKEFRCTCAARSECSHIKALRCVIRRD